MQQERPIVKLDLETTGTDTTRDRIVSIAVLKVNRKFEPIGEAKEMLINPLMPIPSGATAVHGITDEMVKDKPTFASYAKSLYAYLRDSDIAGYNTDGFDLPLLSEEFSRCQIKFPCDPEMSFIDCMKIFRVKEPRDLAGALKFYTGEAIEDAHSAGGDVQTSLKVMRAQFERYPDIAAMNGKELQLFLNGGIKILDLAGKIAVNDAGIPVYNFGKAKNETVISNPGFGEWMLKNDFNTDTKEIVRSIIHKGKTLFS